MFYCVLVVDVEDFETDHIAELATEYNNIPSEPLRVRDSITQSYLVVCEKRRETVNSYA